MIKRICRSLIKMAVIAGFTMSGLTAQQPPSPGCGSLPDHDKLRSAVQAVVNEGKSANTGMGNQEWAAIVNRDGIVCAVAFSGPDRTVEWPGSRLIAAEKANTANALSGPDFALSTANLYYASQPGSEPVQSVYQCSSEFRSCFRGKPTTIRHQGRSICGQAHRRHHRIWRWVGSIRQERKAVGRNRPEWRYVLC